MARVRLNAGGLSAAQVRMGSRGASERLRPAGDDINSSEAPAARLACGVCGSTKKIDVSRPHRCALCRADEQIVREAGARLQALRQPAPGKPVPSKAELAKVRKPADAARKRLAARRVRAPRPAKKAPAAAPRPAKKAAAATPRPAAAPASPRRINAAQKAAGARRLKARIEQMEKELKTMSAADARRDRLREDLGVARRVLADWTDGVH